MRRIYYMVLVLILAVSCKVVESYNPNPMSDINISRLSYNIFYENTKTCLSSFYNAYHIAAFLQAEAEEKVSEKYDIIRTGLTASGETYTFDYDEYFFPEEGLLEQGEFCHIKINYHTTISVSMISDGIWQINDNSGISIRVEMMEEKEDSMKMDVDINGIQTESSEYSAHIADEGFEVSFEYEKPGVLDSLLYDGVVLVEYYEETTLIKSCRMTFRPGLTPSFDVF